MSDPASPSASGDDRTHPEIPDFDLLRPIGQGGFGRVWLARNRATGQPRAVKVIPLRPAGAADPAGREISSLVRLEANLRRRHPNLLHIHHVGKTAEHLFYVMDLADDVSGAAGSAEAGYQPATLESRLAGGPLPPGECSRYARQLLEGLASLHEAGMVHRDVKPSNCLFVGGELKLADFGLLTEASPQVSRVGTQKYMPPDGRMDARADVYAAGLVLYEMIAGLPADSFPRLGERANEIAGSPALCLLTRLALGACQPDPQQRFQDARAMVAELLGSERQAVPSPVGRPRRMVVAAAGTLLVLLVGAVLAIWATRPPRVHVNFVTYPFEAEVYLDGEVLTNAGGIPYRTPCTVDDLPARVHHVRFKHRDRGELDHGPVDFRGNRQVVARWGPGP